MPLPQCHITGTAYLPGSPTSPTGASAAGIEFRIVKGFVSGQLISTQPIHIYADANGVLDFYLPQGAIVWVYSRLYGLDKNGPQGVLMAVPAASSATIETLLTNVLDQAPANVVPLAVPGGGGSGTVTSVAMTVPSWLSVSGSPITTAGTLALTAASGQTANRVLASPDGASGALSVRALVANDIPNLAASKITSGTLPVARGGTGIATIAADKLVGSIALDTIAEIAIGSGLSLSGGTLSATGGGGGSLTVEEADGAPSLASTTTLRFDQADGFVISNPGAGIARVDLANVPVSALAALTVSRALISNGSGVIAVSAVTDAELAHLSGVTSAIQTQLNSKQAGDPDLTALAALSSTGIVTRTASDTYALRSVAGGTGINVTNGDGVAGNPTVAIDSTVATLTGSQTLTNKTLTAPTINGGTATALTGLAIRSTGTGAFDLTFANTENLTAGRTLTVTVNDAARTLSLGGNLTTAAAFTTSGANALTLTTTGVTNVTLPTTGTLATLAGTETLSNKTVNTVASTAGSAGLNLPHGSAPTTPVNGDLWTTTSGLFVRVNGSTVGPLGSGGGSPGGSNTHVQYNNSGSFGGSANFTFDGTAVAIAGSTTNSTLRVGAIELQGYGVNNNWFGDNIYFDGSTFIRRAAGSVSLLYFSTGGLQLRNGASGSAGSSVTPTTYFEVNNAGLMGAGFSALAGYQMFLYGGSAGVSTAVLGVRYGGTGDLVRLEDGSGNPLIVATSGGLLGVNKTSSLGAQLHTLSGSASRIAGLFEGAASNSAAVTVSKLGSSGTGDLYQGQNSSATVLFAIDSAGNIDALGSTSTGLKEQAAKVVGFTDGSTNGGTYASVATTPAQITANQNDYNPGGSSYIQRWTSDAARDVTGLTFTATQVSGQTHIIVNAGSNNIVLKHQNASSTAANRFICTGAADITLAADESAYVVYDATTQRWRAFKL